MTKKYESLVTALRQPTDKDWSTWDGINPILYDKWYENLLDVLFKTCTGDKVTKEQFLNDCKNMCDHIFIDLYDTEFSCDQKEDHEQPHTSKGKKWVR